MPDRTHPWDSWRFWALWGGIVLVLGVLGLAVWSGERLVVSEIAQPIATLVGLFMLALGVRKQGVGIVLLAMLPSMGCAAMIDDADARDPCDVQRQIVDDVADGIDEAERLATAVADTTVEGEATLELLDETLELARDAADECGSRAAREGRGRITRGIMSALLSAGAVVVAFLKAIGLDIPEALGDSLSALARELAQGD